MRDAALLLMFAIREYGYYPFPLAWQGEVFSICGSACMLLMLAFLRPWWPIGIWIAGEELLVIGCSVWWIANPLAWAQEQCSAQMGIRVGAFGLAVLSLVAFRFASRRNYRLPAG